MKSLIILSTLFASFMTLAQDTAPKPPSILSSLPLLIIIFFIFYFLMLRPQKKKYEQEQKFQQGLTEGAEVYTKSGMVGTIKRISDLFITLEIAPDTERKFLRSQVAGSVQALRKSVQQQQNKLAGAKKKGK